MQILQYLLVKPVTDEQVFMWQVLFAKCTCVCATNFIWQVFIWQVLLCWCERVNKFTLTLFFIRVLSFMRIQGQTVIREALLKNISKPRNHWTLEVSNWQQKTTSSMIRTTPLSKFLKIFVQDKRINFKTA